MTLSGASVLTIAWREFSSTVKRKAFLFTAIGTPAYFAIVMWFTIGPSARERGEALKKFTSLGVVDSSGLYAGAEREIVTDFGLAENPFGASPETTRFRTTVYFYRDQKSAEAALHARQISQVLVIPATYLENGSVRRYARTHGLFSSADRRPISAWLARNLIRNHVDSLTASRASRPTAQMDLYALNRRGEFELKDDAREIVDFLLPMLFAMLLGVCITAGGQYLLQGVSEEKESRILESLLCTVSPEELLAGKLLGLGAAGLLLVALWGAMGVPIFAMIGSVIPIDLPATLLILAVVYFLLGYLFYGSLMTGIGAMTNNMREAQQFSIWFTFANFAPFIMMTVILGRPDSALAVGLSLFPPTAATTMMMRLSAPSFTVPLWQIAASIAILLGAVALALFVSARIFRIGLLMYGKTPNLPEIVRWARRA
jgi:ABC-2 type transport system permease protein